MGNDVVWIRIRFIQVIAPCLVLLAQSIVVVAIGYDLNFGTNGRTLIRLSTDSTSSASSRDVFVVQGGAIFVVADYSQQGISGRTSGFGIVRLDGAGRQDPSYGNNGRVLVWSSDVSENLVGSAVDSAGRIVILSRRGAQIELKRFTSAGMLDTTFRPQFPVESDLGLFPSLISTGTNSKVYFLVSRPGPVRNLFRFNSDGSPDSSFGLNGARALDLLRLGNIFSYSGLSEVAGNKLILTGTSLSPRNFFAVRFNNDGFEDRSFGRQGVFRGGIDHPDGGTATSSFVLQDGTIFMAGNEGNFFDTTTTVFKLLPRGRPDNAFGRSGKVSSFFFPTDSMEDILVTPDGKVYAVGTGGFTDFLPFRTRVFIVRYSQTGQEEAVLQTDFNFDRSAVGKSIARYTDGKMIIVGSSSIDPPSVPANRNEIAVAKFDH